MRQRLHLPVAAGLCLLTLALSACSGEPSATPAPDNLPAHVERTGNFRGSTVSATHQDDMVAVAFQPALSPDNATLIAAFHDSLPLYFNVDALAADWRPIRGLALRFETEPRAFDVIPVKDDGGRLAGLLFTQPAQP